MALRVLWRNRQSAAAVAELEPPPGIELRIETDAEKALAHADWAQVLVDGNPAEELLDGAALRHLVVPYAGLNEALQRKATKRPALKVHNSHYNSEMVAQHAVALLLAVATRIVPLDRDLRRGRWNRPHDPAEMGVYLRGRRALLVGYGAIGKATVPALRALGLELTAFRQHPRPDEDVVQVGDDGLHEALEAADAVICSLPLTPETKGLLGAAEFARMKRSAILVNVGRGPVVDEAALYAALAERRIFGAGIDVWYRYPEDERGKDDTLPSSEAFHELDNVVMTPHSANDLDGWQRSAALDTFKTLQAIAEGRDRNLVDVTLGY